MYIYAVLFMYIYIRFFDFSAIVYRYMICVYICVSSIIIAYII